MFSVLLRKDNIYQDSKDVSKWEQDTYSNSGSLIPRPSIPAA